MKITIARTSSHINEKSKKAKTTKNCLRKLMWMKIRFLWERFSDFSHENCDPRNILTLITVGMYCSDLSSDHQAEEFGIWRLHITWLLEGSFLNPANTDKNCQIKVLFENKCAI